MNDEMIDNRLQTIEMKLTFLEDFLLRLQDEVVSRNSLIDKVVAENKALKDKVVQIAANLEEIPNQKPPHY
jgi:SlyX protein